MNKGLNSCSMATSALRQFHYFWQMKNEFLVKSKDREYKISFNDTSQNHGLINGKQFTLDLAETKTGFHILKDKKGVNIDVLNIDYDKKKVELRINHKHYSFEIKDKYDELLEKLGMDTSNRGKVLEIKAPMPGLVIDVMINVGDEVKIDQPIFILEAMKMENVIKSTTDSIVKKVEIGKGDTVEKNQILVTFN